MKTFRGYPAASASKAPTLMWKAHPEGKEEPCLPTRKISGWAQKGN